MGRLRDGYDAPLWASVNEEVIDLFGNEDGFLHYLSADNCAVREPLYGEPAAKPRYTKFQIPYVIQDWTTPIDVNDDGSEQRYEATIFVSREHLLKAGVPLDGNGEMARPGDKFECWHKGDRIFWDIIGVDRQGHVNDSDHWTQYILTCTRTVKYVPERDISEF